MFSQSNGRPPLVLPERLRANPYSRRPAIDLGRRGNPIEVQDINTASEITASGQMSVFSRVEETFLYGFETFAIAEKGIF